MQYVMKLSRRRVVLACLVFVLAYCSILNTFQAAIKLKKDYAYRVLPTAELLRKSPEQVVVVSLQHIAQELATLFGKKYFFLCEDRQALERLATALVQQRIEYFYYLRHTDHPAFVPEETVPIECSSGGRRFLLSFTDLGQSAKYRIYEAALSEEREPGLSDTRVLGTPDFGF
jgi:hypothetical protein